MAVPGAHQMYQKVKACPRTESIEGGDEVSATNVGRDNLIAQASISYHKDGETTEQRVQFYVTVSLYRTSCI